MPRRFVTVEELAEKVAQDPQLAADIQANAVVALQSLAKPLDDDVWVYRIVVLALGLVAIIAIIGAISLAACGKDIPDVLTALGSVALGAIAGLLAPSPVRRS